MVNIYKSDRILESEHFRFDYSRQYLTADELFALGKISGERFYFENDPDSIEFHNFLTSCFTYFIQKKHLYFIYFEPYISIKNKIRSYRKLFYPLIDKIGKDNMLEMEFPFDLNESRFSAIVRITEQNLDFATTHLINSSFAFGYVTDHDLLTDVTAQEVSLERLAKMDVHPDKHHSLNLLKSIIRLINNKSVLFRLKVDGRDNQMIDFFGKPPYFDNLLIKIEETIGSKFYLRKNKDIS